MQIITVDNIRSLPDGRQFTKLEDVPPGTKTVYKADTSCYPIYAVKEKHEPESTENQQSPE